MSTSQLRLLIDEKLIVDLFAGGGGMSVAFERAFGRSPDIAINHNDDALSMHRMNHPQTRHFIADVYEVCPRGATQGRPVGWLHLSPDCTHHSQASGGQPRSKKIRGLAWVGYRWAGQVLPDVISLENVKQILKWGPLIAKRCKLTGRVMKLDGTVAGPGERVPVQQQYLIPDPKREGQTWHRFVAALESLGYVVEWRTLIAAVLGGHTTRERLFMIARRDGRPIAWPESTHHKKPAKGQKKWKPAADCIDFSDLGKSIFDRPKPLAPATMRRIAKGVQRYVLDSAKPFIVPIAHYNGTDTAHSIDEPMRTITAATKGGEFALVAPALVPVTHQGHDRVHPVSEPMRTITAAHRGETMLASPVLIQAAHGEGQPGRAQRWGSGSRDIQEPIGAITASGGHAIAAATLVQTGYGEREGQAPRALDIESPMGTIVSQSCKQALVTAYMMQANDGFNATVGRELADPMTTITNSGSQQQLVTADLADALSPDQEAGALRVAAFLMEYYSEGGQWSQLDKPMNTITTRDRLALVTVFVHGTPYVIVDIRLRMLKPRELFNGQDFPADYIIDRGHDGRKFSISAQVRMCGNSVNPVMAEGFLKANAPELAIKRIAA